MRSTPSSQYQGRSERSNGLYDGWLYEDTQMLRGQGRRPKKKNEVHAMTRADARYAVFVCQCDIRRERMSWPTLKEAVEAADRVKKGRVVGIYDLRLNRWHDYVPKGEASP